MCVNNICRTCKHWEVNNEWRDDFQWQRQCKKIGKTIEIEIDQGDGWDSGGARVEFIETPPHFGCNHWEHWKGTP